MCTPPPPPATQPSPSAALVCFLMLSFKVDTIPKPPHPQTFFLFFFFNYPFYSLRTFLYPSPSLDVIQVQGLFKQTLPPPPHYGTRVHFYPEKTPAIIYSGVFSSSTRSIESRLPSLASRSQQLIPSSFYCANNSKSQTHVGF